MARLKSFAPPDRLIQAIEGLTLELRRMNDRANPPKIKGEAELGRAKYGETEEERRTREEIEQYAAENWGATGAKDR